MELTAVIRMAHSYECLKSVFACVLFLFIHFGSQEEGKGKHVPMKRFPPLSYRDLWYTVTECYFVLH